MCHARKIEVSIDDGNGKYDAFLILPMSIQPLIENCIKHGLKEEESKPFKITIEVSCVQRTLQVCVKDNGPGMALPVLVPLNSEGIGLENIRQRLLILYGQDDLLSVDSTIGEFTLITIRFPQKKV
ncbi:MAG: ATP-binding protein [Sphaerochaetaceae bacterium]